MQLREPLALRLRLLREYGLGRRSLTRRLLALQHSARRRRALHLIAPLLLGLHPRGSAQQALLSLLAHLLLRLSKPYSDCLVERIASAALARPAAPRAPTQHSCAQLN